MRKIYTSGKMYIDKKAVLLYIIIFFSGDTFLFGMNSNGLALSLSRYFQIVICAYILVKTCQKKLSFNRNQWKILSYLVMLVLFVAIAAIHQDNLNKTIVKIVSMTIAFLLCINWSFDEYVKSFNKVIYFISICAIIFTIVAYIAPNVIRLCPQVVNTANSIIYTCGLAGIHEDALSSFAVRTNGLFWEPGVFQMFLNIAIAIELIYKEETNRKYLIAYYFALFLTFSTTGYIVAVWVLGSYVLFCKEKNKRSLLSKKKVAVFVLLIIIICIALFTPLAEVVIEKFSKTSNNYGSTNVRLAGIVANIDIALKHPLIGVGMDKMKDEFIRASAASKYLMYWTFMNTNTFFYQFAAHGILYGLIFGVGTFKFGNCFTKNGGG